MRGCADSRKVSEARAAWRLEASGPTHRPCIHRCLQAPVRELSTGYERSKLRMDVSEPGEPRRAYALWDEEEVGARESG